MPANYFLALLIFISSQVLYAQSDSSARVIVKYDTIKFVNGSRQAAKIIEISDRYVKYKNPLTPDGPIFSVKKKDVAAFILKDGCIDLKQQGFENCVPDPSYGVLQDDELKRKSIGIDFFQLINLHLQLNAEFIFKNRKNGIGIFGNMGLSDPVYKETYERWETKFSAGSFYKDKYFGIDYKIFPTSHKKITYFCGLGIDVGHAYHKVVVQYQQTTIFNPYSSSIIPPHKENFFYESVYLGYRFNNGFIWRLHKNLIFQAVLTLGVSQYNYKNTDVPEERKNTFLPKISVALQLAYAF
jgi:hypothetical protein